MKLKKKNIRFAPSIVLYVQRKNHQKMVKKKLLVNNSRTVGKLWLFWGKEQLQFGCNLIGSTRSSRVPPGTLTSSPTIYSTVMKHRNRCVLSASCVPQEGRRAEQVLNRQKTPLLPYKHMCLHNGEKNPAWQNLQNLFVFVSNNQDLNASVLLPRPWLLACTSASPHSSFSSTCHQVSRLWLCNTHFRLWSRMGFYSFLILLFF